MSLNSAESRKKAMVKEKDSFLKTSFISAANVLLSKALKQSSTPPPPPPPPPPSTTTTTAMSADEKGLVDAMTKQEEGKSSISVITKETSLDSCNRSSNNSTNSTNNNNNSSSGDGFAYSEIGTNSQGLSHRDMTSLSQKPFLFPSLKRPAPPSASASSRSSSSSSSSTIPPSPTLLTSSPSSHSPPSSPALQS
eukprot:CAMPEP_0175052786 /NCGR_PEP_ID=MMETSP0052_2-20121109/8551_1 /TAXON_ID=51329 ORGANISM="Polytomella parva, Strain SAG 63-3" /NCGR_SAMPLE_ID=MMETSP0052_2 /ASSEMBLY_ACC=CAM_ASM_000194 /LENGTH=193 /DNA_ID=CAMNT_0016317225 /DNA_START=87 /DNA_END=665 /DNA_ORIENTATION=+